MTEMVVFVPARGGSKGIIGKNLAPVGGKPLIVHTLDFCQALVGSRVIDDGSVLVSTDDAEIARVCASNGFATSYRRPANLATDDAGVVAAILHGIAWYEQTFSKAVSNVMMLQPTSPLRRLEDVQRAVDYYRAKALVSLVGVTPLREHPYESIELSADNKKWQFLRKPEKTLSGRQSYPTNFGFIDGSLYIASVPFLDEHQSFLVEDKTTPFLIDQRYSIDIDDPEDLTIADYLIRAKGE